MERYIKKPLEVKAIQFTDENKNMVLNELKEIQYNVTPTGLNEGESPGLLIPTLEGDIHVSLNDWIIQGTHGELYPCKPYIFEQVYTKVKDKKERKEGQTSDKGDGSYEESIVNKIDNKEELTNYELTKLTSWKYVISEVKGKSFHSYTSMTTIVQLLNRYFCVEWLQGNSGSISDKFNRHPYEVEKTEYERKVKVTEWRGLGKEEIALQSMAFIVEGEEAGV